MNTVLVPAQVSLFHVSNLPAVPSPTTCCRPWILVWFCSRAYRAASRRHPLGDHGVVWASPPLGGWPRQPAESSSSSYGPAVHLQLLSTPSHEDAVTFGYNVQTQLGKDSHPADSIHLQAHERGRPARIVTSPERGRPARLL